MGAALTALGIFFPSQFEKLRILEIGLRKALSMKVKGESEDGLQVFPGPDAGSRSIGCELLFEGHCPSWLTPAL